MKTNKTGIVTGLDIGSYSVKCVEVVQVDGKPELSRAQAELVTNDENLKKVLEKMDVASAAHLRVSLSGSSIITRFISMPSLSAKELQGAIRFEAESHIPFPIDECVLDYQVLKQDAATKQMAIMLVAAKRDIVESRYRLMAEVGAHPEVIDLDVFCLLNAFEALNSENQDRSYGLLNIGHNASSLAMVHDGLPVFAREIPHAGSQVTKALAEIMRIPETQAEQMKIEKPVSAAENLKFATQKGFESLSEEIRHSIDFVENEIKDELKRIYLSGGGALASDASQILAEEIGRPVMFWDNQKNIRLASSVAEPWMQANAAKLNVALGMTLRNEGKA